MIFSFIFCVIIILLLVDISFSLYDGAFSSTHWIRIKKEEVKNSDRKIRFFVFLKLRDVEDMKATLLKLTSPSSVNYGQYLSLAELNSRYSLSTREVSEVVEYFKKIEGSEVELNGNGDMLKIIARKDNIEELLQTELAWHKHKTNDFSLEIKNIRPFSLPSHISNKISFISINSPLCNPKISSPKVRLASDSDSEKVRLILSMSKIMIKYFT